MAKHERLGFRPNRNSERMNTCSCAWIFCTKTVLGGTYVAKKQSKDWRGWQNAAPGTTNLWTPSSGQTWDNDTSWRLFTPFGDEFKLGWMHRCGAAYASIRWELICTRFSITPHEPTAVLVVGPHIIWFNVTQRRAIETTPVQRHPAQDHVFPWLGPRSSSGYSWLVLFDLLQYQSLAQPTCPWCL
jgi:hypothetical protein